MTKQELVRRIAGKTKKSEAEVKQVVESMFEVIKQAVADGDTITLRKFGTFKRRWQTRRKGQNVKLGVEVEMQPKYVPRFEPSDEFKELVKDIKPL